ncbi:hypothetical protein FHG87_017319, partial [Trinorchestia longiramus]
HSNMRRILYTIVECSEGSRSELSLTCSGQSDSDATGDDWRESDCIPSDWKDSESETGNCSASVDDVVSSSEDTLLETVYLYSAEQPDSLSSIPEENFDDFIVEEPFPCFESPSNIGKLPPEKSSDKTSRRKNTSKLASPLSYVEAAFDFSNTPSKTQIVTPKITVKKK